MSLFIYCALVFFTGLQLQFGSSSIQTVGYALACAFMAMIILCRGKLYFSMSKDFANPSSIYKNLIVPICAFWTLMPTLFVSYWWVSLIAAFVVYDKNETIAKFVWNNRSAFLKKYESYSDMKQVSKRKIESDGLVVATMMCFPFVAALYWTYTS